MFTQFCFITLKLLETYTGKIFTFLIDYPKKLKTKQNNTSQFLMKTNIVQENCYFNSEKTNF